MEKVQKSRETCITVAILLPDRQEDEVSEHLDELEDLIDTAGAEVIARVIQRRDRPDPATFIGRGKAEEITHLAGVHNVQTVVFDDDLTPAQIRNLEKIIDIKILDRSSLIMDIFASHARTREAKTQVELAQYRYLLPRLTRQWTHLSRQVGGIGVRGVGETQLETDRRIINRRISHLQKELDKINLSRKTQRARREQLPRVSIVGYTNAGKSTLFNQLTRGEQKVEDRLFATLDSKISRVTIGQNFPVLFSDTVGFIRKLPHHLVASFRSTLEEALESDLVLLLLDISHPAVEDHETVAREVLADLGVQPESILKVYNKIDRLAQPRASDSVLAVSARTGEGLGHLLDEIQQRLMKYFVEIIYAYPIEDQESIRDCMRRGTVLDVHQEETMTHIKIRQRRDHR
ncbi:MAG TPA: GTPase HflX [Thermoanaerobaculia bacterium]|mgnify:CR=1 FL=1|nr:GTPase HflX [Thermoanaerobaculia bacterium]HUM29958.1 GTPase HflX [Thermoanaerobaculia bacterium]HXK68175.1 GTPase HflX [Thermoanaerobaculia bacterium]